LPGVSAATTRTWSWNARFQVRQKKRSINSHHIVLVPDLQAKSLNPWLPGWEQKFGSVTGGILVAKRDSKPGRKRLSWDGGIGTPSQTLTQFLDEWVPGLYLTGNYLQGGSNGDS